MSKFVPKNLVSNKDPVELGFLEEIDDDEEKLLKSIYFPSKVGGRPALLSFQHLPAKSNFKCKICSQPLCFLLQVYAPEYDIESAFHRCIFLFVCRNGNCNKSNSSENFVAFRCQLPRINQFYAENAIEDDDEAEVATKKLGQYCAKLCAVCQCPAENRCSKCKQTVYCDRSHQLLHWKLGHKEMCGTDDGRICDEKNELLFKQYELVTETEVIDSANQQPEKSDAEKMREFDKYAEMMKLDAPKNGELKIEDLEHMSSSKDEKLFKKFSNRLQHNPEQVLRYQKHGQPLWVSELTPHNVPCCEICGAARAFEFQIMPHLLSYLGVDDVGASLDWATVAVYTCSKSCDIPEYGYATEFVWKQDF